jgi:hypothetical protein
MSLQLILDHYNFCPNCAQQAFPTGAKTLAVSIQQINPKGFLKTILVVIKLFWLKLCYPEAEIVKPLGFLTWL